jgi:hypothetical protein
MSIIGNSITQVISTLNNRDSVTDPHGTPERTVKGEEKISET